MLAPVHSDSPQSSGASGMLRSPVAEAHRRTIEPYVEEVEPQAEQPYEDQAYEGDTEGDAEQPAEGDYEEPQEMRPADDEGNWDEPQPAAAPVEQAPRKNTTT